MGTLAKHILQLASSNVPESCQEKTGLVPRCLDPFIMPDYARVASSAVRWDVAKQVRQTETCVLLDTGCCCCWDRECLHKPQPTSASKANLVQFETLLTLTWTYSLTQQLGCLILPRHLHTALQQCAMTGHASCAGTRRFASCHTRNPAPVRHRS
jgi:hypothetical protein